ncbi:MAG TPA: LptA/OstA family protein [Patescibacteria group bacterium]|nr:LptA/OstA family protein [Patescibacteria group bacterium]
MKSTDPIRKITRFSTLAGFLILAVLVLLFFPLRLKNGKAAKKTVDTEIEGVNLTYYDFDKNNQKKLEIKCRESQRKNDDQLLMKEITATIFKTGKLDKDIHITAKAGIASNNFYDFQIQDQARIFSDDFSLSSQSFLLKDLDILSSQESVEFKLKNISGRAKGGLQYYINQKALKLFASNGVWIRAGRPYDFGSRIFRVIQKKNLLILEKNAELAGSGAIVRSDWISMQFDADFINLKTVAAIGNSYFRSSESRENGLEQSREISANLIKMLYDPQGKLQQIQVHGNGRIVLADQENNGWVQSEAIEISLNAETQNLDKVRTLSRGSMTSQGQDNVKIKADSLLAVYGKDGVLAQIQAEGKCEFATNDFSGTAVRLDYSVPNSRIKILGKDAAIISKKNIFNSSQFLIQTKLRHLSSDQGVKATLIPEKKNVLLRAKPVFVTASGMEMSEKGDVTRFMGNVKLFQDEIELQAGELLFETKSNRISCRGYADLKFFSDNDKVVLHGKTMVFHADELKIVLEGDARLQQAENMLSARKIELAFNHDDRLEKITAADQAAFSKKDLSGKAQFLNWFYTRKIILFKNSAEIIKKNAGTTRGQELTFDLSNNEISVSSADDRSETVIQQKMP